ncbi:RICIN domain-containing protein [Streptomyces sp. NPDC002588]|uniref:RICIN domain-containing protein n=1 Tax=Streptomyces sp. NPDC002588 TaxID=3154419 RepID=UPI003320800C
MIKEIRRVSEIADESPEPQADERVGRVRGRHRRRWTATGLLIGIPAVLGPFLLFSQSSSEAATIDATAYYHLISVHSGKLLDVNGNSTADGAAIIQYQDNSGKNQEWQLKSTGDGYYELVNRNSGKVLEVKGASTADFAAVQQATDTGAANQQWQIDDVTGGAVKIVSRNSGKVLDVRSASTADGAAIIQYHDTGGDNQQWKLAAVAGTGTPSPSTSETTPQPTPTPSATTSADPAQQVLATINQAREAAGLRDYSTSDGLNRSAAAHTAVMADGCGLSHQCPGEAALGARETAAGVKWTAAGENIGESDGISNDADAIARAAVDLTRQMLAEQPPSDGHRRNILSSSFAHVGISVYRDSNGTVWMTQDFSD